MNKSLFIILMFALLPLICRAQKMILLEAESFQTTGGWVINQQFIQQMGSPYLLAHGMGEPVKNASTVFHLDKAGTYNVWVRTKDWAPFPQGPVNSG